LADEPVASLDPKTSRQILGYIRDVSRANRIAVLCNLHQIDYAMEFGQRIVGLCGGRVVFDGKPEDLTSEILARIYPGLEDASMARLVRGKVAELRERNLHPQARVATC